MRLSDNLFWRRLHSFTGAVPLGAFLLFHLYTNSYSLAGPIIYDSKVQPLRNLPYLLEIEITVIFLPLLYHSFYGLYIWYTGQSNVFRYAFARNWLYTLQRITGGIAFVFVYYHIFDQRLRPEVMFANVTGSLANPAVLVLYIVGVAATAWHLFNGVWNVWIKWGATIGKRAQAVSLTVFSILGLGLIFMGLRALVAFIP